MKKKLKIIDLFCGAGGLSQGLENLGCDPVLHVDNDKYSLQTIASNSGSDNKTLLADLFEFDVRTLKERACIKSDPFLIVGGPPCQPFSKNSYWTEKGTDAKYRRARAKGEKKEKPQALSEPRDDQRRFLVDVFAEAIETNHPDGFVFENVASILHPRSRAVFQKFLERMKHAGYGVSVTKSSALSYGVAQKRERVFVLGMAKNRTPPIGAPTHMSKEKDQGDLLPIPKVGDVLNTIDFEEEKGISVTGRWAQALFDIPPGKNYKALTAWAGHPRPIFEAETRFWNFLLKLSPELPSWTIASQPGPWTGPFHWDNRRLTSPEMAAIQGFRKGYVFSGNRRERIRQIGNAVPPAFAEGILRDMVKEL